MNVPRTVAMAACILLSLPVAAQDEAVTALLGDWAADCDAWGTPATCRLSWERGHHERLLTVRYRIESRQDGAEIFSGSAVYRLSPPDLTGYWSDSGGALHPLRAMWEDNTLTTRWGRPGTEEGRTEYARLAPGVLRVTDWALTDEGWRQFMQVTYDRRQP
ncbi:MAG: hypothetical protein AAFX58_06345 [Pseudomonadota bacterium]